MKRVWEVFVIKKTKEVTQLRELMFDAKDTKEKIQDALVAWHLAVHAEDYREAADRALQLIEQEGEQA